MDPERAFLALASRPYPFWLDSSLPDPRLGRWSLLGSDPFLVLRARGRRVEIEEGSRRHALDADPFDVLRDLLRRHRTPPPPGGLPFAGGAVGYLAYDLNRLLERLPARAQDDLGFPELYLGLYAAALILDHATGRAWAAASAAGPEPPERALDRLCRRLAAEAPPCPPADGPPPGPYPATSNLDRTAYLDAVARAREYIIAGDVIQVNLSQRFTVPCPAPTAQAYLRLRWAAPAPFAAYLGYPELAVLSASPERFLEARGGRVVTRPIKGTRPRGRTPAEDRRLAAELAASQKDRAEHVMIVDLERNDLGRVCRPGTVRVTELMALETYSNVHHLTSTVEGRLREGLDAVDLLRAAFPGGSVTGAPKIRAMEIIDELEPTRRSVYTGAIGYLGFHGDLDLSIVIRTALVADGRAHFQVGGAVVYDSQPEAEYRETLDKARGLAAALGAVLPEP
ncbi:MAG TPA: aminodeoxychorismate synthase component I [Dehalococcoidia bacterium]